MLKIHKCSYLLHTTRRDICVAYWMTAVMRDSCVEVITFTLYCVVSTSLHSRS